MMNAISLSPSQHDAFQWILHALPYGNIFHLWTDEGLGRSTILRLLHKQTGGRFVGLDEFVDAASSKHPLALEDSLEKVLREALAGNDLVLVDDFHVACEAPSGGCHFYPRSGYLNSPLTVLASTVSAAGKKLIVGASRGLPSPLQRRSIAYGFDRFSAADYAHLCRVFGGERFAHTIDFERVHRFAPALNAHQLRSASVWCAAHDCTDSEQFIDYLRSQQLTSNVDLAEVAPVSLASLRGVDDVVERLEASIVMPFENDQLAAELGIRPKRGVLLSGPPGTGKTTVGRALAHRLKGKFFLIDGTMISGTRDFYSDVHQVFEAAKTNAPSVIFIDDSDVIFESGQEHGLYRYLLTMLDGLESGSIGRVCVMLTAMNVGNLPPALIRSGRIELWLEMRHPDDEARAELIRIELANLPPPLAACDTAAIVTASQGFSGADMKRLVEDAKTLFAFDKVRGRESLPPTQYFLAAAADVRSNKERYERAEAQANASRTGRPTWFNPDFHLRDSE